MEVICVYVSVMGKELVRFSMHHCALMHFHKCALCACVVVESAFSSFVCFLCEEFVINFSQLNLLNLNSYSLPIVYSQIFRRNHKRKIPNLNSFGIC